MLLRSGQFIGFVAQEIHQFTALSGVRNVIGREGLSDLDGDRLAHAAFDFAEDEGKPQLDREMAGELEQARVLAFEIDRGDVRFAMGDEFGGKRFPCIIYGGAVKRARCGGNAAAGEDDYTAARFHMRQRIAPHGDIGSNGFLGRGEIDGQQPWLGFGHTVERGICQHFEIRPAQADQP